MAALNGGSMYIVYREIMNTNANQKKKKIGP